MRGIRLLAKNVRKWGRALKVPEIRLNLSDIIVMQELIGTGGGGYRFMYSAFLKEAAGLTGNARLEPIAGQFLDLGTRWREFAAAAHRWCKERTNPGEEYEMLPGMLEDIAGREQKAFADLKAAVN